MFLAPNIDEFRLLFKTKLKDMLSPDMLGAYILVLANSLQDEELRLELFDALKRNRQLLEDKLEDGALQVTQDDIDVFRKLGDVSVGQVSSWSKHQVGVWEVMSNPFRSLRPSRISRERITGIQQEFDADRFNFNKAFLQPEVLWKGGWEPSGQQSFDLKVLYNKFPFIPYHLIIVPDPALQTPQFLTKHYHDMIWGLVSETDRHITGFGAGYNSLGACASVNHLHFHSFIRASELPVELKQWSHNGGNNDYPMRCISVADRQQAWETLQAMNEKDESYNILYRSEHCFILPRKRQGSETISESVSGAGWMEECGVFVADSSDMLESLTEEIITENLKSLSA